MAAPNILTKHLNVDIISYIMVIGGNNIDMFGLIASCKYFHKIWHSGYVKKRTIRAISIFDTYNDCYATLLISPGNKLFMSFEGIYGTFGEWNVMSKFDVLIYKAPYFEHEEIYDYTILKIRYDRGETGEVGDRMLLHSLRIYNGELDKLDLEASKKFPHDKKWPEIFELIRQY